MPNIVGIVDPTLSREEIQQVVEKQLARVKMPHQATTEHTLFDQGIGMALQDTGLFANGNASASPYHDGNFLLLDGEVHNTSELVRQYLRDHKTESRSARDICLALLSLHGPEIAVEFNGLFTILFLDSSKMELHIITDRYGFRSVYYAEKGGRFLFASEMKAICIADTQSRKLDEIGLAEQFLYGSPVMEKTWIEDYERLGPAGIITASKTGIKIRKYWSYLYDESAPTLDQETYFTVYAKKLASAVEPCMSGEQRKGIFLSGGYDSRAIAAAIHPSYLPMPAFTFGDKDSRDVIFGSQLADRLGFQHHVFHHHERRPFLYDYCRQINWRTEGMLSFGHVTSIRNHDLFAQHMDIVLTGFLGEFNGSHTWPRLLLTRSRTAAAQVLYDHHIGSRHAKIAPIFQKSFLSRVTEGVNARFFDSLERVDNDHPMNLADSWNLSNVQPRGTFLSPVVDRHRFEIRTPHMDIGLVDFLLTIPPYSRLEQRVYKKMIAYAYPQVRDIACTNSAKPINPRFVSEYTKMAGRYFARKSFLPIQRLLGINQSLGRDITDRNKLFREEPKLMTDLMLPMLEKGVFDAHVFNTDAINSLVRDHYNGRANHWELISLLISWGLGASYFLYDDLSEAPDFVH